MTSNEFQDRLARDLCITWDRMPTTWQELWLLFANHFGFEIPFRAVCPEHRAPFEFVADACFERFASAILQGPRGGGKTRDLSLIHGYNGRFRPGCRTTHVAARERQGELCYSYLRTYLQNPALARSLAQPPRANSLLWRGGGNFQLLPGTIDAVSGPHPHKAVADEFDLFPWPVYQQFLGMALGDDAHGAQSIYASTMVTAFGPLARLIEESETRGIKVYKYCIFEAMAPCKTCPDFDRLRQGAVLAGTPDCPLWHDCLGRCYERSPTGGSTGHISKEDVIAKFRQSDDDIWSSQYLCRRVSAKGLVYDRFDPTPAPLGQTNVSPACEYNPALPAVWFLDLGYAPDPTVILAANVLPNGDLHVFNELYFTRALPEEVFQHVHATGRDPVTGREGDQWLWHDVDWTAEAGPRPTGVVRLYKKPEAAYVGVVDKALGVHLGRLGLTVRSPKHTNLLLPGIQEVRRMVCDHQGHRGLVFNPRCKNAIKEFSRYHRRRLPNGEFSAEPASNIGRSNADDACDCVRMFAAFNLQGSGGRIDAARHGQGYGYS
jgi:hypothetical protein